MLCLIHVYSSFVWVMQRAAGCLYGVYLNMCLDRWIDGWLSKRSSFLTWSFESFIYHPYCSTKMVRNSHSTSLSTCFEARSKHWRLPDRRGLVEERPEPHQRRSDHGPKLQMVGGYVSKIKNRYHSPRISVGSSGRTFLDKLLYMKFKTLRFVILEMLKSYNSYRYLQGHSSDERSTFHVPVVLQGFRMHLMHISWAPRCTRNGALVRQASCARVTSRDLVCIGIVLLLPGYAILFSYFFAQLDLSSDPCQFRSLSIQGLGVVAKVCRSQQWMFELSRDFSRRITVYGSSEAHKLP